MGRITVPDGGKLAYHETGSGSPLVMVHGSPGEARSWSRVAALLAERHRVLMPDLPGYGQSDPLPSGGPEVATARMGAAIGALIETCREPVRLCGHSYGGNVAIHASLAHAGQVRSLALFEPVFFRALRLAGDEQTLGPAARFFAAYADRVTGGEPGVVREMVDYWFGPGAFARMPSAVQSFLRGAAAKNAADVRATFAEQVNAEQLAGFRKPALVVYGEASPAVAPAIAKALARLLPLAQLRSLPGANHGMLDSHPGAVADLIRQMS